MIVLRRRLKDAVGLSRATMAAHRSFRSLSRRADGNLGISVLVTSLDEDTEAFGQLYRDRGDEENISTK